MWVPRWVRHIVEAIHAEASTIQEAINKQADASSYEQTANREKEQGTVGALRSISDEIKTGNQQADAASKEGQGQQERLIRLQGRLVLWAALAFFAAFGYGLVAAWQGWLMRTTYVQIKAQTAAAQDAAKAAQESADVSQESVLTAQRGERDARRASDLSLRTTIDNFHLDQRAWLGPKGIDIIFPTKAPDPIGAVMVLVNSGKTVATKVTYNFYLHPSEIPIDPIQYAKNPVEKPTGPGGVFTVFPGGTSELRPFTGSTDQLGIESVKNGRKLIYFFASVKYFDIFGRRHVTRICALYYHTTSNFGGCPGNYDYAN